MLLKVTAMMPFSAGIGGRIFYFFHPSQTIQATNFLFYPSHQPVFLRSTLSPYMNLKICSACSKDIFTLFSFKSSITLCGMTQSFGCIKFLEK